MTAAAVLAGGRGRRLGGAKPGAVLGGRPLVAWPLAALRAAGLSPVVVAKRDTVLPPLDVPVVHDADPRHHPLAGILAALQHAGGPVVVVAADMPFLTPELLRAVAHGSGPVAVAVAGGRLQPLCARYGPAVTGALARALAAEAPLRATVSALAPVLVEADPAAVANVNSPRDLEAAEARLARTPPSPR